MLSYETSFPNLLEISRIDPESGERRWTYWLKINGAFSKAWITTKMRDNSNDIVFVGHIDSTKTKMMLARFETDPDSGNAP